MSTWTLKAKTLAATLAVSMLVVPVALAKGKPPTAGQGCKPQVSVILKGTLVSVDSGAGTLTMTVESTNRHGGTLVTDPATSVTIKTNADTKVRRAGAATLADLVSSPADRVMVQLRVCKQSAKDAVTLDGWTNATTGILAATYAKRVIAHPAQPESN